MQQQQQQQQKSNRARWAPPAIVMMAAADDDTPSVEFGRDAIAKMKVKDIKAALEAGGIGHADALEKDELVDRLAEAQASGKVPGLGTFDILDEEMPSMWEAEQHAERVLADEEGAKVIAKLESDPKLMQAAVELAQNGDAALAKYADDEEVLSMMRTLQRIAAQSQQ